MSRRSKQYYIVVNGRRPGIYTKWFGQDGAADQVVGFQEAMYKGFYTREEAIEWLRDLGEDTLAELAPALLEEIGDLTEEPNQPPDHSLETGKVLIHTDGAAIPNPGPGGYAAILRYKHREREISGGFRLTTNNRMEIMACIQGLRTLKQPSIVIVFTDSRYVVDTMTKGWARKWREKGWQRDETLKAQNADLWSQLLELCDQHQVEFRWTRGHSADRINQRCDQMAIRAAQQRNLPADDGYETHDR
jgi:ribonuclease HI